MQPTPNPQNMGFALAARASMQQTILRSIRKFIDAQNATNASLRDALPIDPRESPPLAVAPAPDGGVVGRLYDVRLCLRRRFLGPVLTATLQIERWDPEGKPDPNIAAEMCGGFIEGMILPGDWVQLPKNYDSNQLQGLTNLTRGTQVAMKRKRVRIDGSLPFSAFPVWTGQE
jgi:hypothetical protein